MAAKSDDQDQAEAAIEEIDRAVDMLEATPSNGDELTKTPTSIDNHVEVEEAGETPAVELTLGSPPPGNSKFGGAEQELRR